MDQVVMDISATRIRIERNIRTVAVCRKSVESVRSRAGQRRLFQEADSLLSLAEEVVQHDQDLRFLDGGRRPALGCPQRARLLRSGDRRHLHVRDVGMLPAGFDLLSGEIEVPFHSIRAAVEWEQRMFRGFGAGSVPLPRLTAMYGAAYTYSGIAYPARGFPMLLEEIRAQVVGMTGIDFDSVLCNLYRDGSDSVSWHSDDDYVARRPEIASVSFGGTRRFRIDSGSERRVIIVWPTASTCTTVASCSCPDGVRSITTTASRRPRGLSGRGST